MFDKDRFIEDVRTAVTENSSPAQAQDAVLEVLARTVSEPRAIIDALGPPGKGRTETLYVDDDVTILNLVWGSQMWAPPHDHTMWAAIGVYQGQEDNTFWRESPEGLSQQGGVSLVEGDVRKLGENAVHSVKNPSAVRLCGALHVYGGDFFKAIPDRRSWDPDTLAVGPYDYEYINELRKEANTRMEALIRDGVDVW